MVIFIHAGIAYVTMLDTLRSGKLAKIAKSISEPFYFVFDYIFLLISYIPGSLNTVIANDMGEIEAKMYIIIFPTV